MLDRIFVPELDDVTDCWGKLYSEELHKLHCFFYDLTALLIVE